MKNNWKKIDVVVEDETTNEQPPEKKTNMDSLEILNHIQKLWKERGIGKTNDSTPGDNNEKWKQFVEEERRKDREKEEKKKKFCETIKEKEEKLCKKKLDRIAKQLPIETLTCEPKDNIIDKSLIPEVLDKLEHQDYNREVCFPTQGAIDRFDQLLNTADDDKRRVIITAPYRNLMGYQIPEDVMKDGLKNMK